MLQVSQTFPVATAALGGSGTFLVYSCIAAAGAVWVFFTLPETTGVPCHIMLGHTAVHIEAATAYCACAGVTLVSVCLLCAVCTEALICCRI